jgi:Nuclease-related domain
VLCLACAVVTAVEGAPDGALLWIALAAYLASKARERLHLESSFRLGAEAEERVGILLDEAMGRGWAVEHDVLKQGGGNIDHVVHSPSMTFTIDTKRSWWREQDLDQAHRHAEWAARYYGAQRPIVPIVCVQRSSDPAMEVDGVVVVGSARLLGFLDSMHCPESIAGDEDLLGQSEWEADFEELFGVGA